MKITLSKSQWANIGKQAGWITANGFGIMSGDISDVFEAKVMMNKTKSSQEILQVIRSDEWLYKSIQEEGINDDLLLDYINEQLRYIKIIDR